VFIFIATNRVRPGRLDDERRRVPGWVDFIRSNEPRLLAFHEFLSADGTEVEYVQMHPDIESFEHHLRVLEQAGESYRDTLEATTSIRIYGQPSATVMATLRQSVGPDVPITVLPTHLGGFS
jgi:hypothetical protein